jgi:hypothetical protein
VHRRGAVSEVLDEHSLNVRYDQILVYPSQEPLADPLPAKGIRRQDGAWFMVEVTTGDGKQQSIEWEYPLLKLVSQVLQPLP